MLRDRVPSMQRGHPERRDERPDLEAAYEADRQAVVRARVELGAGLFVAFVGLASLIEGLNHGDRSAVVMRFFVTQIAAVVIAVLAMRLSPRRSRPVVVGVALMAGLSAQMCAYNLVVTGPAERLAMAQTCMLTSLALLIPWGWRAQAAQGAVVLAAYAGVLPHLHISDGMAFPLLGLTVGATVSVAGAAFMERSRHDTFVRTVLLREEAETAAALADVAQLLSTHLDDPNMLERVNRFAVATLGCTSSESYVWDDACAGYRVMATVGLPPDVATELKQLEFSPETTPLVRNVRPGEVLEIADTRHQMLVPVEVMEYFGVTSSMYAPITRGGVVIGAIGFAWNGRRGPFSRRDRRLALGIAHATAIAMENARLIRDLQAASRLKSDFVATMSHELRTPLNVIMGYSDLLADGDCGPLNAAQRELLDATRRSAVELLGLVNATLDLNRLDTGHDPLEPISVAIDDVFGEVAGEVAALRRSTVELRWHDATDGRPVVTDRVKLKTILKNLVGNALKFTDVGAVEIAAQRLDGTLTLTVRDSGIGIAADQQPVIFDMFRQVDGSSTRRHGGVGLGLHIVKRLADTMGGAVTVDSAPGRGATFTVVLPELRLPPRGRRPREGLPVVARAS